MEQVDDEIKGYIATGRFTGLSRSTLERLVREKNIPEKKDGGPSASAERI